MRDTDAKFRKQEFALQILKYIAIGAVIGAVLVCPNLAQLYTLLDAKDEQKRRRIRRNIYTLQKKGLLKKGDAPGAFHATARGTELAEFDQLTITPRKWDGKWRLFMFDIPETHRLARRVVSRKVSDMGMQSFQKSVFITPYPCEVELQKVMKFLHIEEYARLVIASRISDEPYFKKKFGL